jgi:hypothetical protein
MQKKTFLILVSIMFISSAACDSMIDDKSKASESYLRMMLSGHNSMQDSGLAVNPGNGEPFWSKAYGTSLDEVAFSACMTADGGYLIAGYGDYDRDGVRSKDGRIIKIDAGGKLLWERYYGGTGEDTLLTIIATTDSNFVAAGYKTSRGNGGKDAWVIKIGRDGGIIWDRTFGGVNDEIVNSIIQNSSGGYMFTGTTGTSEAGSDVYAVRLNDSGNLVWEKRFGGMDDDVGNAILEAEPGMYIVGGYSRSFVAGYKESYVFKINNDGAVVTCSGSGKEWNFTYGMAGNNAISSMIKDASGGYIMAGYSTSPVNGLRNCRILKIDSSGAIVWDAKYAASHDAIINSICQAPDGSFMAVGSASQDIDNADFWILGIDGDGNKKWQKTYGGPFDDAAFSIIPGYGGSFVVAGYMTNYPVKSKDFWVINVNSTGDIPVK